MAALEWNCYFNNDTVCVTITGNPGYEPIIKQSGEMDANTHAAVHVILEAARCLMKGISIKHYFNPTIDEDSAEVWVKCQWMRSGKLFCIGETTKKYHHVTKVDDAMMQKRTFTCTRALYHQVPKRRPATKDKKVSSGKPASSVTPVPTQNEEKTDGQEAT